MSSKAEYAMGDLNIQADIIRLLRALLEVIKTERLCSGWFKTILIIMTNTDDQVMKTPRLTGR